MYTMLAIEKWSGVIQYFHFQVKYFAAHIWLGMMFCKANRMGVSEKKGKVGEPPAFLLQLNL